MPFIWKYAPLVARLPWLTIRAVSQFTNPDLHPLKLRLQQLLTLQRKVLIALIALTLSLLAVFVGLSHWGLQRSLGDYVAEVELSHMDWLARDLEQGFAEHGGWQFLEDPKAWQQLQRQQMSSAPRPGARPPFTANDDRANPDSVYERMTLLNAEATRRLAGSDVEIGATRKRSLRHKGKIIGYLAIAPLQSISSEAGKQFVSAQLSFVVLTGCFGGILALAFSWILARRWLIPIHELMAGAQAVAQGKLQTQVPVHGHDELAHLTLTFNAMTQRLAKTQESRQRWLSDIAHELRTPLTAMQAEIEATLDGIRPMTAETGQRMHSQVLRLTQLVDDMRASMTDSNTLLHRCAPGVRPLEILWEAVTLMRERFRKVDIQVDTESLASMRLKQPELNMVAAPERLHQVFVNLLENSLKYTDPGGQLKIEVNLFGAEHLLIRLDDSAPAPLAQDLPLLFERLYRSDTSRNRSMGGSGLGLAICKAIVESHGGAITADLSPLGGLRVDLMLPLSKYAAGESHAKA